MKMSEGTTTAKLFIIIAPDSDWPSLQMVVSDQTNVLYKLLPMTGFKLQTSDVESNSSDHLATTTDFDN